MNLMIYRLPDAAFVTAYSMAMHMDAKHKDIGRQHKSSVVFEKLCLFGRAELLSAMISCFSSVLPAFIASGGANEAYIDAAPDAASSV